MQHSAAPAALPPFAVSALQVWDCAAEVRPLFADIDRLVHHNLKRVQQAFRRARIAPHHFAGSTGYGHGDLGRTALDEVTNEMLLVGGVLAGGSSRSSSLHM